jgi:hypothetical protein
MLDMLAFPWRDGSTAGESQGSAETIMILQIVVGHDRIHSAFSDH